MSNLDAIMIAEGVYDAETTEQYYAAWQQLIDTGLAWSLQGWFGRQAVHMIEQGHCTRSKTDS
tara:strand:- start:8620 stop:8808 length:189 start_codon:yes stop_codon:yes gene_type:complete